MKPIKLTSLLALTAVGGAVVATEPAAAINNSRQGIAVTAPKPPVALTIDDLHRHRDYRLNYLPLYPDGDPHRNREPQLLPGFHLNYKYVPGARYTD